MKTCPDCAEEIKEAARLCRFCGFRFDAEAASAPSPLTADDAGAPPTEARSAAEAPPRKQRPGKVTAAAVLLLLLSVPFLFGGIVGLPVIPDAIADAPSDPLIWLLVLVILFTLMLGLGCLLAAVLVWRLTNAGRVMGLVGAPIAIALTVALVIGGFSMADPEVGRVALAILIGVGLPPLIFWLLWKERQAFR